MKLDDINTEINLKTYHAGHFLENGVGFWAQCMSLTTVRGSECMIFCENEKKEILFFYCLSST